jgi:hypothetical protein
MNVFRFNGARHQAPHSRGDRWDFRLAAAPVIDLVGESAVENDRHRLAADVGLLVHG